MPNSDERLRLIAPLRFLGNVVGVWPQRANKFAAKVLFIIFLGIHWINTYFQIEFFSRNISNLNNVTEGCCTLFSIFLTGLKLHRFYSYKEEIGRIFDKMLNDDLLSDLHFIRKAPQITRIMKSAWNQTKNIMWLQIILVGFVAFGYSFVPFLKNLNDLIRHGYKNKYLVYNLYYPLWENMKFKSPLFEVLFISESISGFTTFSGVVIFETFYVLMVLHVTSLLKILNEVLVEMGAQSNGATSAEDQRMQLKECYILHLRIIELANLVNEICSPINLLQLLVSTTLICLTLFQTLSNLDEKSLVFCLYLAASVNQLFLYCWFGQKLINQSLKLPSAVYLCGWETFRESLKPDALIILKYSQIPIQISSWKLMILSLETFLAVVRSSFSYYMILRTLSQE